MRHSYYTANQSVSAILGNVKNTQIHRKCVHVTNVVLNIADHETHNTKIKLRTQF